MRRSQRGPEGGTWGRSKCRLGSFEAGTRPAASSTNRTKASGLTGLSRRMVRGGLEREPPCVRKPDGGGEETSACVCWAFTLSQALSQVHGCEWGGCAPAQGSRPCHPAQPTLGHLEGQFQLTQVETGHIQEHGYFEYPCFYLLAYPRSDFTRRTSFGPGF